jgi:malate dehydrogenase (oxaloacetate-decarboxylating)(NADP+)
MNTPSPDGGLSPFGGPILASGQALLTHPLLNKGTAFTERERDALGLRGLLPPRVFTIEEQLLRVYGNYQRKPNDLEKYIFLAGLQNRNETLFYRLVQEHAEEMIPIIYTPTVGQACIEYGNIFRRPRGIYLSLRERGRVAEILRHWPYPDTRLIVVTDGERILGLGDLGVLGMGIPVGKLALYTACAGLHPYYCLPITLDVGTDNLKLREDPLYMGLNQARTRGAEYDAFVDEFVTAVGSVFPRALIQWEDFGNTNAFRLLRQFRHRVCSFNDDIQGTAAVALAGLIAALRLTGGRMRDQRLLFLGAGEAATGIAELFVAAAQADGLSLDEARARCWFVDSQGLVVRRRAHELAEHKLPYAHDLPYLATFAEALQQFRPTALLGAARTPRTFTREIIAAMAALNARPVIFALSNPTSKAECTAEEAYQWSDGRAIFASGSPFPPVQFHGRTFVPGQGNNVYVFPGIGLGALACEAASLPDNIFLTTAHTLAAQVSDEDLAQGRVYPSLTRIREVSARIAVAVAEESYRAGLARRPRPADLEAHIRGCMFQPAYREYL